MSEIAPVRLFLEIAFYLMGLGLMYYLRRGIFIFCNLDVRFATKELGISPNSQVGGLRPVAQNSITSYISALFVFLFSGGFFPHASMWPHVRLTGLIEVHKWKCRYFKRASLFGIPMAREVQKVRRPSYLRGKWRIVLPIGLFIWRYIAPYSSLLLQPDALRSYTQARAQKEIPPNWPLVYSGSPPP